MTLGHRIQEIRKARGYSQESVAKNLGISSTAYAKIERDESDISVSRLEDIAKVLKVNVWTFFSPQSSILIIGDIQENQGVGHNGTLNNYPNDFTEERKTYQLYIQDMQKMNEQIVKEKERHINLLEQQLLNLQKIADKFLK
jgi:transcriptional regulator with XRE-family HTH domain